MHKKDLKRIYDMSKNHIKTIIIVSILALIVSGIAIARPYIIKIAIDDFLSVGIFQKGIINIPILGAIYIGLVLLENIFNFAVETSTNIMGENIIYEIRNKLYMYIQKANISFHDNTPAGKLFARITNDVEDISALFKDVVCTLFKDVLKIIAIICIMIYLNKSLSLILIIAIVPAVLVISSLITNIINKLYNISKNIRTKLNTFFAESIYGAKLIKIFNIQDQKQNECEQIEKEFTKARMNSTIWEGLLPGFMKLMEGIGIAIIVYIFINKWFGITLEVGIIYIFVTYLQDLFEPIRNIVDNIETVQDSIVSINKIYDILEDEEYLEDFDGGIILPKTLPGKLEFKHVWFKYKDDDWVLKDINFVIEPGETIALVGKTGSGKTTITNLVNRFYDIQKGEILLDGVNIKDINLKSLREHVGTVLQDPFIFAKSVADNIKLDKDISLDKIKEAVHLASADDFINSLPNGLDQIAR